MFEGDSVRGAFTAFLDAYGRSDADEAGDGRQQTDADGRPGVTARTRRDADPPVLIPAGVGWDSTLSLLFLVLGLPVSASSTACFSPSLVFFSYQQWTVSRVFYWLELHRLGV